MNKIRTHAILAIFSLSISSDVFAQVYKCAGIDGTISYQETSCDLTQQESLPITIKNPISATNEQGVVHSNLEDPPISRTKQYKNQFMSIINHLLENIPVIIKNNYIPIAIIFFGVIVSLLMFSLKRKPKEKYFTCSRCNNLSPHTPRTIEAWRNNKKAFFCQECHSKWLRSQPMRPSHSHQAPNSGCLGILVVFATIPLALFFI